MNAFFFFQRKTMTSGATMMMMIAVADDIRTKCNSIWTAKKHFLLPFILAVFLVLVNFGYTILNDIPLNVKNGSLCKWFSWW